MTQPTRFPHVSNKLWLISDTHFGHKNIITFQQRPETHEVIMLSEWIDRVGEDDPILHLGDVFMGKGGNARRWASVISRLPGRKYLILGNHDKSPVELYRAAGFQLVKPFCWRGIAFTHRPVTSVWPAPRGDWSRNVHGHTHGNDHHPDDGTVFADKTYHNVSVELTDLKPVRLGNVCPL